MATDYYALLGVSRDASPDEIKRAYRQLARELHPDVNPDPASVDRFKEVTAAYEVLSDPEKRQMYDLGGDPLRAGGGGFGAPFDFGDLMDAFFGGGQRRGPRPRMRRGQDALIRLQVDLAEAMTGATREVQVDTAVCCEACQGAGTAPDTQPATCPMCKGHGEIQNVQRSFLGQVMTARPCPQCQGFGTTIPHPCVECAGDGRVRTRTTIGVRIPPGVDTGTRIQLAGQGEVGPGGGEPGDLFVEIETLDGVEQVEVRPGTQPGAVLTLRARGVPHLRGSGRGDLHIQLDVRTPTRLDDEQEGFLRSLARARGEEGVTLRATEQVADETGGFFSRLRGAFSGR